MRSATSYVRWSTKLSLGKEHHAIAVLAVGKEPGTTLDACALPFVNLVHLNCVYGC